MMQTRVVSDNGLTVTPKGCDIDIRLPWYRALPLSVCSVYEVTIDGVKIDLEKVTFEINGITLSLDQLKGLTSQWWFTLDSAILHVTDIDLVKNNKYEVAVTVSVRPPYINKLNRIVKTTKTLVAQ
ncbi:DUF6379 domain-containing protein [Klebsiella pneumoniae]|nr:DUF6379 domain-containing protein [Klebsiella pneumoniae]